MKFNCDHTPEDYLEIHDEFVDELTTARPEVLFLRVIDGSTTATVVLDRDDVSRLYDAITNVDTDLDFNAMCSLERDDVITLVWEPSIQMFSVDAKQKGKTGALLLNEETMKDVAAHLRAVLQIEVPDELTEGYKTKVTAFDGATLELGYDDDTLATPFVRLVARYQDRQPIFVHVRLDDFVRATGEIFTLANDGKKFDGEVTLTYEYEEEVPAVPATTKRKIELLA
jgi:hypothetical protein